MTSCVYGPIYEKCNFWKDPIFNCTFLISFSFFSANCELDSLSAGFTEMSSVTTGNSKRMSISTSVLPQPFGTRPELMLPSPPKETPRVEVSRY